MDETSDAVGGHGILLCIVSCLADFCDEHHYLITTAEVAPLVFVDDPNSDFFKGHCLMEATNLMFQTSMPL